MWDFKKRCIQSLFGFIKSRTAFKKILLARKYKVKKWLRDGYLQLLQEDPLELGDNICTSQIDMITCCISRRGDIMNSPNAARIAVTTISGAMKLTKRLVKIAGMQDD